MRLVVDQNLAAAEAFRDAGDIVTAPGRQIDAALVRDADALIVRSVTRVDAALLEGSRVRFVGSATAGTDHVDTEWLASQGIAFAHAPGCNADAVTEYVVAVLLEWACTRGMRPGGVTFGIVGIGQVGARVVRAGRALGMTVVQNDPPLANRTHDPRYRPIDELLGQADVVTLHVPLTREGPHATQGMVNAAWLAQLPPAAFLINTSRGEVIDESALLAAVQAELTFSPVLSESTEGLDGADALDEARMPLTAALDVWCDEPAPDGTLVASADWATPHIAGYSDAAKLAGTAMVHAALCHWAGITPTWKPQPSPRVTLAADPAARHTLAVVRSVVRQVCDVAAMTQRFRDEYAASSPTGASAAFDQLRREFCRPRQFADVIATGITDPAAADMLRRLGIRVA